MGGAGGEGFDTVGSFFVNGQSFSTITEVWCHLILNALYRQGVRDICIAPGSRSAPLVLAAARYHPQQDPKMRLHCHFDERGLGFFALGIAKASQCPVGLITTSGTAVANLYPAVIEAFESNCPLVLLTADRPDESLNCGANQAINQGTLFGENVVSTCQLPVPSEDIAAKNLEQKIHHTLWAARELKGPVHINCPFREPLYGKKNGKGGDTESRTDPTVDFSNYLNSARYDENELAPHRIPRALKDELFPDNGIIIAGQLTCRQANQVLDFAKQLGWPIFADINSQLRLVVDPMIVHHHALLLLKTEIQEQLKSVEQIIQFGGRLTSKPLTQWLDHYQGNYRLYNDSEKNLDPTHRATRLEIDFTTLAINPKLNKSPSELSAYFSQQSSTAFASLDESLFREYNELAVVRNLSLLLPEKMALFAGNSLSIRMLEWVAQAKSGNPVYCNRGASGIDGLLATAVGCGLQHQDGLTLLIGDTSLLHDLNSLALARDLKRPFVIVVLNNDGGSIFDLVAQQAEASVKERFFRCPHGLQFSAVSTMFGIAYTQAETLVEFEHSYRQACQKPECSLIEVNVAAGQTVKLMKLFTEAKA